MRPPARRRRRGRGDDGIAAIELPLAVGLLLLPITVLVLTISTWPERQTIGTAAAKQAASVYANAADPDEGAALAQAAVDQAASNAGISADALSLVLDGEWCRGCAVTASVTVEIPAVAVPFIGEIGAVDWTATSTARIDDYRSIEGGDE